MTMAQLKRNRGRTRWSSSFRRVPFVELLLLAMVGFSLTGCQTSQSLSGPLSRLNPLNLFRSDILEDETTRELARTDGIRG